MPTINEISDFIKSHMDFQRFSRLTAALGHQLNDAQLRFLKAMIFELSIEEYSQGHIKYVGQEGADLIILSLDACVEMKYIEDAIFTAKKKILKEKTGNVKLMNSMGTNSHKLLPVDYANYLLLIGNQGAMLFDKTTIEQHITIDGDGIVANIPTNKGIILATPDEMSGSNQTKIDFIEGLRNYIKTYINTVK
jgi:hypothetical protein